MSNQVDVKTLENEIIARQAELYRMNRQVAVFTADMRKRAEQLDELERQYDTAVKAKDHIELAKAATGKAADEHLIAAETLLDQLPECGEDGCCTDPTKCREGK